jgi:hypothetical protein
VRVEVADDGEGIPESRLDRVFERFEQVDARGSGATRSTGLGLTFCRLAVEAMGGTIGVESKLREGTTFSFTLQMADEAAAAEARTMGELHVVGSAGGVEPRALSEDDRRRLAPFAAELAEIPIYRVSALNAVLERLEVEAGRDFWWTARVRDAVFLADEAAFRALLEEV